MQAMGTARGHAGRALLPLLVVVALAGCSRPSEAPSAPPQPTTTSLQDPQLRACLDTYAGRYASESPLPSHPRAIHRLTLRLESDWTCSLTTEFAGSRHAPTIETGTWRCDGNRAEVLLTGGNKGPEREEIRFQVRGGLLVATRFDRERFGEEGLTLRRE